MVKGGLDLWGKQMMSPLGVGLPPSLLLILTPCMLLSPLCLVQSHSNKVLQWGLFIRGATGGAACAPKPGKAPIMAARRRCHLLFFKIKVSPRPCRPYQVRRRCNVNLNVQPCDRQLRRPLSQSKYRAA